MKYYLFTLAFIMAFAGVMPAQAHERSVLKIGSQTYLFTVGSLNEPIYVDDKTGVELRIQLADPKAPEDGKAPGAKPVEGLEKTLKVELQAGNTKKVLGLEPAFRDPGAYRAAFYPTIATTIGYRIFGTIADTPVGVTFTCSQADHSHGEEHREPLKISDQVTRLVHLGAFGCPRVKDEAGFPEPSATINDLKGNGSSAWPTVLSGIALVAALSAYRRSRRS